MSYSFVDTNDIASGSTLPEEAMCFNGVYIENEIEGYRTLSVSGRELMASEIGSTTIDGRNGAEFRHSTYPARTITVRYQLSCADSRTFREAFNKLNGLLSAKQAKVSFADEPDKYFIGTRAGSTEPDDGTNCTKGEFEILCTDPFKHSSAAKEFKGTWKDDQVVEVVIENSGTVPVPIDYEIKNTAETGYIGIVSDQGAMQFGKVEEADGQTYKDNETLVTLSDFISAPDDTGGTDYMHPQYGANGTLATHTWFGRTFLGFGSTGTKKGNANGGLRTIEIPADSNGAKGCKNFYAYIHLIFYAGLWGQTGEMCINFLTSSNRMICGLNWYKTSTNGNDGRYELVGTDGKVLRTYAYTTSHLYSENPWYWDWGHCDIRKEGSTITFFYYGGYPSFVIPEAENLECAKIQIAVKQWGDRSGNRFMSFAGFDKLMFQKLHVDKWKDVPNRYSSGSTITIDGETTKFFVNGMQKQEDEVRGTKYFKAPPGKTTVKVHSSTWVKSLPEVTARIREEWI